MELLLCMLEEPDDYLYFSYLDTGQGQFPQGGPDYQLKMILKRLQLKIFKMCLRNYILFLFRLCPLTFFPHTLGFYSAQIQPKYSH